MSDNKKTAKGAKPRNKYTRTIIAVMWSLFVLSVVGGFTLLAMIYNGVIGYMPAIEDLKNPKDNYASVIYSADGVELGRYFRNTGNRVRVNNEDVSKHVTDALVATEDVRFYDHSGIDVRAMARVIVKTLILQQRNAGGGSTITQQLAKLLYSPTSENIFERALQKPIEWMIAIKLERYYSKEEIINMYLNRFDFLYNALGIKSAAYVYFGKEPKDLTIEEAATLVGMVKNPSYYNPVRRSETTRKRRNVVLHQMYRNGVLTSQECDSLQQLPLVLDFHRVDHKEGPAPYFREELRRILQAKRPVRKDYFEWEAQRFYDDSLAWATNPLFGWAEKNPKADGSKYDIYTDGLKIFTTIDSRMQKYAEDAVVEHFAGYLQPRFFKEKKNVKCAPYTTNRGELSSKQLSGLIDHAMKQSDRYRIMKNNGCSDLEIKTAFETPREMKVFSYDGVKDTTMTPMDSILYLKHFLRAGFMSMDPRNGHVKAYVGGPNFTFFQYDMVSTGRRQVGSTIKPFLYTYAMEEGFTPCDEFLNEQPTIFDDLGRPWTPRNASKARIGEMVPLSWALTTSNNWISARIMEKLSPTTLVRLMHNLGITNQNIMPAVSLCLGPCEVSVKEMVTAYTAYANNGLRVDPLYVTAIADANGNVISEFTAKHTEVISQKAYYRILTLLLGVVDGGTGNRIRRAPYNITAQTGGKTGTTNDNADGWFMAFTPQLVSGVWVGGEERYIHFNGMADGQGASMALPIYGKYMSKVYADESLPYSQDVTFKIPSGVSLCEKENLGEEYDETEDESIDGIFD